jgi:hypothetical protein
MFVLILTTESRIMTILFTVHPVHVEAVASIVGRADALCGLFYFLALFCYTLSVRISRASQKAIGPVVLTGKPFAVNLLLIVLLVFTVKFT